MSGLVLCSTAGRAPGSPMEDLAVPALSAAAAAMRWNPVLRLLSAEVLGLVLRARREILPGFGFILPAAEAERFAAAVPSARVAEIDANHYTITTHDDSIAAIGAFLRPS